MFQDGLHLVEGQDENGENDGDVEYDPRVDPTDSESDPVSADINRFTGIVIYSYIVYRFTGIIIYLQAYSYIRQYIDLQVYLCIR